MSLGAPVSHGALGGCCQCEYGCGWAVPGLLGGQLVAEISHSGSALTVHAREHTWTPWGTQHEGSCSLRDRTRIPVVAVNSSWNNHVWHMICTADIKLESGILEFDWL